MTRPREPQAFLLWARMQPRPALEAEVDRRQLESGAHGKRQAMWNRVAAEWFRAADESEQAAARAQAKTAHDAELSEWERRILAEPTSPEDAIQYVQ